MSKNRPVRYTANRRYFVIAQRYQSGLKVAQHFDTLSEAELYFNGQFAHRNEITPFELGIAFAKSERGGRVSWGLFEPLPLRYVGGKWKAMTLEGRGAR
jgi:hypothetical protein